MPRPLRPLVAVTLGCALVAGGAAIAAAASGTTTTAAGPASSAKAPKTVAQVLELVRSRAVAQQDGTPTGTAPGSIGTLSAEVLADPEPTPSATDATADPTPTSSAPEPSPTTTLSLEPTSTDTPPAETPPADVPPTATMPAETTPTETTPTDIPPTETTPTDLPPTSIPPVDTKAPTGTFVLSKLALWTGQKLTLTQSALADAGNDPAGIARVVKWGDGSSTTVAPGATKVTKAYAKKGKFTVSVTLTDAAGNAAKAKIAKPTVTITVPGATFKLSKKAVWHHESFKVTIAKVPSGTSKITLDRGDGAKKTLTGKNQAVTLNYYKQSNKIVSPGTITLRATFTNKNGASAPVTVGKVTLKKDSWKPTVKFTKPAKANATKASAWSTIRGTAADKGAGVRIVQSVAVRVNSAGTAWCFTTTKKWLKLNFEDENQNVVSCLLSAKVSKGKWSYKVTGLKKGYVLGLVAGAVDWAGKESSEAEAQQALTRS